MNAYEQSIDRSRNISDSYVIFGEIQLPEVTYQRPFIMIHDYLPKLQMYKSLWSFVPRWNYRPDYCSYDVYGTTNLYWLVLYICGCPSLMYFHQKNYKELWLPDKEIVLEVLTKIISSKKNVYGV